MTRPRVLFVQPFLLPVGGGHAVAAWMLQALQPEFDVTLLVWRADVTATNRQFGTAIDAARLAIRRPPALVRRLVDQGLPVNASRVREAVLRSMAHRIGAGYDAVVSACNEVDLGRPSLQYVHYPNRHWPQVEPRRWYHVPRAIRAYEWATERVAPFSDARMRRNATLANSRWTAALIERLHGVRAEVLHPPAHWDAPLAAWADREPGFVCIGRVSPEKRLELIVDVLRRVRQGRPDVHLHLVGPVDHARYGERIARLVHAERDWIEWHRDLDRPALEHLIARHRFGIHAMAEEHFGMAIAEMQRAGCLVFAPRGGGQMEIADPALQYTDATDAVERIAAVVDDEMRQQQLSAAARARTAPLTPECFMAAIRERVHTLMETGA